MKFTTGYITGFLLCVVVFVIPDGAIDYEYRAAKAKLKECAKVNAANIKAIHRLKSEAINSEPVIIKINIRASDSLSIRKLRAMRFQTIQQPNEISINNERLNIP